MPVTTKDVLASISKLRGATVGEISADLGKPAELVLSIVADLAQRGMVKPMRSRVSIAAAGNERFSEDELANTVLDVTSRGFLELQT